MSLQHPQILNISVFSQPDDSTTFAHQSAAALRIPLNTPFCVNIWLIKNQDESTLLQSVSVILQSYYGWGNLPERKLAQFDNLGSIPTYGYGQSQLELPKITHPTYTHRVGPEFRNICVELDKLTEARVKEILHQENPCWEVAGCKVQILTGLKAHRRQFQNNNPTYVTKSFPSGFIVALSTTPYNQIYMVESKSGPADTNIDEVINLEARDKDRIIDQFLDRISVHANKNVNVISTLEKLLSQDTSVHIRPYSHIVSPTKTFNQLNIEVNETTFMHIFICRNKWDIGIHVEITMKPIANCFEVVIPKIDETSLTFNQMLLRLANPQNHSKYKATRKSWLKDDESRYLVIEEPYNFETNQYGKTLMFLTPNGTTLAYPHHDFIYAMDWVLEPL